jgi:hypothetical protein
MDIINDNSIPEHPVKERRISTLSFPNIIPLAKTFFDHKETQSILNFFEDGSNYDSEWAVNYGDSDLHLMERTEWDLYDNIDFKNSFKKIIENRLYDAMMDVSCFPRPSKFMRFVPNYKVQMYNIWFARCKKGGYTDPHNHGLSLGCYSFVYYLKLPSKVTSLTFSNSDSSIKDRMLLREGDMIVFPSNLLHWSFDTEDDRCLLAGNFVWSCWIDRED